MPSSRSELTAALTVAAATMAVIYEASGQKAALIAALVSAAADVFSVILRFLQGRDELLEQWADDLASQVARAWSHRLRILLGWSTGLTTAFGRRRDLETGVEDDLFEDGDWSSIGRLFLEQIPTKKLVILGDPGSGKTLIMLRLVTQLLKERSQQARKDSRTPASIPVPISVVGWDGALPLQTWLIGRLRTAYNLPKRRAHALVERGYIMPVLDGLDEATDPGTDPYPIMRILYRLSTDYEGQSRSGGHPLVVTCREREYANLPDPGNRRWLEKRVPGAPVVVMRPLDDGKVLKFLQDLAQARSERIDGLADYLTQHDTSPITVEAMRSPLVTSLAVRSAIAGLIDYHELSELRSEETIRSYFISIFVSSTVAEFPKEFGRRTTIDKQERSYDTSQESGRNHYEVSLAQNWLYGIAKYLMSEPGSPVQAKSWREEFRLITRTDKKFGTVLPATVRLITRRYLAAEEPGRLKQPELRPQDLWKVAESAGKPTHRVHVILAVLATLLTGTFGAEVADGGNGFICWAVTTALAGVFALRVSRPSTPGLSRADFQRVTRGRTAVMLLPVVLLAGALAGTVGYHVSQEASVGVTEGIAGAALATLLSGLSRGLARAVEPLDGLRNDLRFGLIVGVVGAIAIGFPGGLTGGLWSHLHLTGLLTRPGSEALAFLLAVPCGVILGSGGWLRLQIAAFLSGGKLIPRRPILFLQWAESTGLLRAVGTNYQFRHDDLRVWLLTNGADRSAGTGS